MIYPTGRGVISYRKRTAITRQSAAEIWLDIKPDKPTRYHLNGLVSGYEKLFHYDGSNVVDEMFRKCKGFPISGFHLDRPTLLTIQIGIVKPSIRNIILDPAGENLVDVNDQTEVTTTKISQFSGSACQFSLSPGLVKSIPLDDYWIKIFGDGYVFIESINKDITIYSGADKLDQ